MSEDPFGATSDSALDDRTPLGRLRQAELRVAFLEGQLEALRAQVAAVEATDEHRRTELAAARSEAAEAEAAAREARARAEERRHLIDELRTRLAGISESTAEREPVERGTRSLRWRGRRTGSS